MVQRVYCSCSICKKTTMVKYQVGYEDFPVIYTCPNCLTEIRGFGHNDGSTATVSFSFQNAAIVGKLSRPDYYLSISREFPTALIKKYDETDEHALSPFMSFHRELQMLNDKSLWKRVGRFAEKSSAQVNYSHDLIRLWENGKKDLLADQLKRHLPSQYFPLNNTLEIYRGLHTWLVGFVSDLLPDNWTEQIKTFNKISALFNVQSQATLDFIKEFEQEGLFKNFEHKLFGVLECFFKLAPNILPAFLMLDCPSIRDRSEQYAISTISFDDLLDFYQKSYEAIIDSSEVLIALNNVFHRGNFDVLAGAQKHTLSDRRNDTNKYLRLQQCLVDGENFSELIIGKPRNRIRNSIGHFSTEFDGLSQTVIFLDTHKGQKRQEAIPLSEFAVLCVENFHTCFYLLEVIYQIRKWVYISKGDVPCLNAPCTESVRQKKVGRNELCTCGSGKKYKKCCGR